ncbi:MAG TPA: ADOP family duplicated permease [Gemmatimonadales bacterium]|jgi:predicted permease
MSTNSGAGRWTDVALDLRQAGRGVRRQPMLAVVLVLVLGFGIGTTTATYSLVDALLLRPLPVSQPDQLVIVGDPLRTNSTTTGGPRGDLISYPLYHDVLGTVPSVQSIAASSRVGRIDVVVPDPTAGTTPVAEHPAGRLVSGNYFATLGVNAWLGRTFPVLVDGAPGDDPVVVVSYRYWQNTLHSDSTVVGHTLVINHVPLTIVGVMPRGFDGEIVGQPTAIWIPTMMEPSLIPVRPWLTDRNTSSLLLIARLAPGATIEQARSTFNGVIHRTIREHATAAEYAAQPARDPVPVSNGARGVSAARGLYGQALLTLLAAVVALLLLAIANAANLSLARSIANAPDTTVRTALGASPFRLMRQGLVEHAVIGAAAAALGLAIGAWGSAILLRRADPVGDALLLDVHLNSRVTLFAVLLSIVVVLAFGVVPIAAQMRSNPAQALRGGGRSMVRSWSRGARALVTLQVALSILLIATTTMLRQSLIRVQAVDAGFNRQQVLVATVDLARSGITLADRPAVMQRLLQHVRAAPGVLAASYSVNGMYSGAEADTTLQAEGFVARSASDTVVQCDYVGPGFFTAIAAHLIGGRDITEQDDQNAPRVAVVNQSFAHFFFGNGNAVGRHLQLGTNAYEVIGVVADIQSQRLRDPVARRIYTPIAQRTSPPGYITFAVRGSAEHIVEPVRRALLAEVPSLIILSNQPVENVIASTMVQDRLLADVVTFFGVLALFLAGLGIYGVIANATVRRTREFGIRLALGAPQRTVIVTVVTEALRLVIYGVGAGVVLVILAAPLLRRQLFGIGAIDAASIVVALVVMLGVAALAGLLPALRSARLEPVEALRAE